MAKRALLIGINDYRGNGDLGGCVNDVMNIRDILKTFYGYSNKEIRVLTDRRATKENILFRLKKLVSLSKSGDTLFVHYSGHGAQIRDRNNDELSDGMDELICPHDMDWDGTFITDDDLNKIFRILNKGVHLEVVMDCCHSGSNLKEFNFNRPADLGPEHPRVARRMIPPQDIQCRFDGEEDDLEAKRFNTITKDGSNRILWAGCKDYQTSSDAWIAGDYNGAFTFYFCDHIRGMDGKITRKELIKRVRTSLRNLGFDQIPQLEFNATKKADIYGNIIGK